MKRLAGWLALFIFFGLAAYGQTNSAYTGINRTAATLSQLGE